MKHLKKTFTLLMLLMLIINSRTFSQHSSRTFAADNFKTFTQDNFRFATAWEVMQQIQVKQRAREIMQDNEYTTTGYEQGSFLVNPLMLDGEPLDYSIFGLRSKGELTLAKEATTTAQLTQIPFYMYLRRNGKKVFIPGKESPGSKQIKIEISEILNYAKPGDQLIIEPARKEDGPAKRILKLLENGC
jgi:hypothetical protein